MNNILLIVTSQKEYDEWKGGDLLLDMKTGNLINLVDGINIRRKLLKLYQQDDDYFSYPLTYDELTKNDKLNGALTYEEFKNFTVHVDKKILNDVVSIVVKY